MASDTILVLSSGFFPDLRFFRILRETISGIFGSIVSGLYFATVAGAFVALSREQARSHKFN